MKNHEWRDGSLIQTNKKWSALKESQRTWIYEVTAKEHAAYVTEHGSLPMKKRKDEVIERVYAQVEERGIWIPYGQFDARVRNWIDRLNHKSPLFTPPKPKKPPKPKTPRVGIEEFPEDIHSEMAEKITASIRTYIQQAHRIPANKIRDGHINTAVRSFNANSKNRQTHGKLIKSSDMLIKMYHDDELLKRLVKNSHKYIMDNFTEEKVANILSDDF